MTDASISHRIEPWLMLGHRYYDNTRVAEFKDCPRKFFLRHSLDIRPARPAMPLIFGSCWHEAMNVVWANIQLPNDRLATAALMAFEKEWTEKYHLLPITEMDSALVDTIAPRHPGVAFEMICEYIVTRRDFIEGCEILAIERPFAVPIDVNDPNLFYVGRLDKVVRIKRTGEIYVVEHKTSTAYRKDGPFRADFIQSFSPNSQVDGYIHALMMLYQDQFPVKSIRGVMIDAALVHKVHHDGFRFIPVERASAELEAWRYEAMDYIQQIERNRRKLAECSPSDPALYAFPKNTGACTHYGGCPFLDICKVMGNPLQFVDFTTGEVDPPQGFIEEHWAPDQELELKALGLPEEGK